jgi:hypothetical protein
MAAYPRLSTNGFEHPAFPYYKRTEAQFEQSRADLLHPISLDEFIIACAWLSYVPKVKKGGPDSYEIKHVVEDWSGLYVSNGIMICAAIHDDFRVESTPRNVSATIGIGDGRYWPLRPGTKKYEWVRIQWPGNTRVIEPPHLPSRMLSAAG